MQQQSQPTAAVATVAETVKFGGQIWTRLQVPRPQMIVALPVSTTHTPSSADWTWRPIQPNSEIKLADVPPVRLRLITNTNANASDESHTRAGESTTATPASSSSSSLPSISDPCWLGIYRQSMIELRQTDINIYYTQCEPKLLTATQLEQVIRKYFQLEPIATKPKSAASTPLKSSPLGTLAPIPSPIAQQPTNLPLPLNGAAPQPHFNAAPQQPALPSPSAPAAPSPILPTPPVSSSASASSVNKVERETKFWQTVEQIALGLKHDFEMNQEQPSTASLNESSTSTNSSSTNSSVNHSREPGSSSFTFTAHISSTLHQLMHLHYESLELENRIDTCHKRMAIRAADLDSKTRQMKDVIKAVKRQYQQDKDSSTLTKDEISLLKNIHHLLKDPNADPADKKSKKSRRSSVSSDLDNAITPSSYVPASSASQ